MCRPFRTARSQIQILILAGEYRNGIGIRIGIGIGIGIVECKLAMSGTSCFFFPCLYLIGPVIPGEPESSEFIARKDLIRRDGS